MNVCLCEVYQTCDICREAKRMTESEAQDVLLGLPEEERVLRWVKKALQQRPIVDLVKGRVEVIVPTGHTAMIIYKRDDV